MNIVDKYNQPSPNLWAVGWIAFAGVLMIIVGLMHAVTGLTAIVNDDFFVVTEDWVFQLNPTAWGWINLIVGLVVSVAGVGLFTGRPAARIIGIVIAAITVLTAFAWLPHYPAWGAIEIALGVAVLWALIVHGDALAREQNMV
ncbi:MAG: DUF7144 family membrane protein [Ilumatobacteraceae bacterium]